MSDEITYSYLRESDIDTEEYRKFIEMCYGEGCYDDRRKRMNWYWQLGDEGFRVLTAKRNNEYVGQSCAYRVYIFNNHIISELWWGVGAFVLEEMRGKGIGKNLQKRLHRDVPNFSSAWYSPTNGAIKRKCGAHGILTFPMAYYPVSSFCSIALELVLKKIISRKIIIPRLRLPFFYSMLNGEKKRWMTNYQVEELPANDIPLLSDFIKECLKNEQLYVVRSKEYLQWKYVNNPRMICRTLSILKGGQRVGLAVFSDVKDGSVVMAKSKIVKIYESLFTNKSGLSNKKILEIIIDYYHKKGLKFDGVLSLQTVNWFPSLVYPRPASELLSTMPIEKLTTGYITYSDQDME